LVSNQNDVTGTVVEFANTKTPVENKLVKASIPAAVVGGGIAYLLLRDASGKEVGRAEVPVRPPETATAPPSEVTANDFKLPKLGIATHPIVAKGVFSENSSLSIGEHEAQLLAMSPRTLVAVSPKDVVGLTTIRVKEGAVEKTAEFRNLSIAFEIDQNELLKHQSTTARLRVQGLEKLSQPVRLQLVNRTPDVISVQGGEDQTIVLGPGGEHVSGEGIATVARRVRAQRAGNFRIDFALPTAEVYGESEDPSGPGGNITSTQDRPPVLAGGPPGKVQCSGECKRTFYYKISRVTLTSINDANGTAVPDTDARYATLLDEVAKREMKEDLKSSFETEGKEVTKCQEGCTCKMPHRPKWTDAQKRGENKGTEKDEPVKGHVASQGGDFTWNFGFDYTAKQDLTGTCK
jgi:hypothetical protein